MTPFGSDIGKILITVGRTVGMALIAGVGSELAKVAGAHLNKHFGPKKPEDKDKDKKKPEEPEKTPEEIRAENEKLKAEVDRLREELGRSRG